MAKPKKQRTREFPDLEGAGRQLEKLNQDQEDLDEEMAMTTQAVMTTNAQYYEAKVTVRLYCEHEGKQQELPEASLRFVDPENNKTLSFTDGILKLLKPQALVRVETERVSDSGNHFQLAWPVMTVFVVSGAPNCQINVPMIKIEPQALLAKVLMHVFECDHDCGGHERRRPIDAEVSVYKVHPSCPPLLEQRKEAKHGCVEFCLPANQWYEIKIKGRQTHAGACMKFFACAEHPAEFDVCCKPALERTLKLLFKDEYHRAIPYANFRIGKSEHFADERGEFQIENPLPGKQAIEPAGTLKFKSTEILIGTADQQTAHITVRAQTAAEPPQYLFEFEVQDYAKTTEEIHIVVHDPRTHAPMLDLIPDQTGTARCFVSQPDPHLVSFKIGQKIVQQELVTPQPASH
jgi:hypothetical protein